MNRGTAYAIGALIAAVVAWFFFAQKLTSSSKISFDVGPDETFAETTGVQTASVAPWKQPWQWPQTSSGSKLPWWVIPINPGSRS